MKGVDLVDTVGMMMSEDFEQRFIAEYLQLDIRMQKTIQITS